MKIFAEIIGWYGVIAILLAYSLVSFSMLEPTNVWYPLLNGTGALGIIVVSFYKKAYQPGVLNIIWLAVAFIAGASLLA